MTMDNRSEFEGYGPLPGLEHLGRHISDADGQPSGSPANFEQLRGARHPDGHRAAAALASSDTIAAIAAEYADVGTHGAAVFESSPAELPTDAPIMLRVRQQPEGESIDADSRAKPPGRARRERKG